MVALTAKKEMMATVSLGPGNPYFKGKVKRHLHPDVATEWRGRMPLTPSTASP